MKLTDHFKQHLSSDIAASRRAMTESILRDAEALAELEASRELWFDVSLADLGQRIARILDLRDGGTGAHLAQINSERWHGFRQLEKIWLMAINTWLDAEFQHVDLRALEREENLPEPEFAA